MKRSETRPEEDSEWFEFGSLRDVWPSGFRPRKLRFYADHDFPLTVVEGIRDAGLAVVTAYEDGRSSHDDGAVYRRARALDRILLTNDGDFWSDRRHRLMDGPGVIIVAAKDPETVATLLDRFYSSFASALSRDWWPGTKIRIGSDITRIKLLRPKGIIEYAMREELGRVLFREIRV